jgi:4-hydroxybenzoate polyprenyltransferase
VVGVVAAIAGAEPITALRLAIGMTALQASIGSLNDVVDAPRDAGRKPGKPIPAGLVSRAAALSVIVGAGVLGVALSIPSGAPTTALAFVVLGIGYAYDLGFKGTAWSWLPFAVGIPLLPVYGWLGTAGHLPGAFAVLLPAAVLAGAGLAISNALADVERDAAAGTDSVATRLGSGRAWAIHAILLAMVTGAAWLTLGVSGPGDGAVSGAVVLLGCLAATALIGAGIALSRRGDPARRERAWELEAVGVGVLAAAWLAGVRLGG